MGKHKEKSRKHKKDKQKSKKQKRKYRSSSSSEEEWVEKKTQNSSSSDEGKIIKDDKQKRKYSSSSSSDEEIHIKKNFSISPSSKCSKTRNVEILEEQKDLVSENHSVVMSHDENNPCKREDWMSLPSSFLTASNHDRKREKDERKRQEKEKQQYNPRECSRELNPYWKDGGDGLPSFKKPQDVEDQHYSNYYHKKERYDHKIPNWKKKSEIVEKPISEVHNEKSKQTEKTVESSTTVNAQNEILSEKELNILAAKLVKAEIMGNTKLINELKEKLENARQSRNSAVLSDTLKEEVLLTHTDSQGRSQPVKLVSEYGESSGHHKRKRNIETHKDGHRVRYFADDDTHSLKQMFENEKFNSVNDQNSEFVKMTSKLRKNDDLDDIFSDNIRKKESESKINSRNRASAVNEHHKISKSLDNCNKCIQSELMPKHLMISMGDTTYLALPPYEPLTEGHCCIIPIRHVSCSTLLDENEWTDILNMRKSLVNLFISKDEDVIFFETAMSLHRFPHMHIECIPLPKADGDMAPIYFKKAIDESEAEWAHNKKLISLKGKDVRRAIPKGLPYFFVSFGMEEGFAHVIEDEQLFPANFAQEIIGGILDLHHSKWRKPKRQSFEDQSKRVLNFSKEWKDFDCTV